MPLSFNWNYKELSPMQLTYNLLVSYGLMNQQGRPWSQIVASYHLFMMVLYFILTGARAYVVKDNIDEFVEPFANCIIFLHLSGKFFNILLNQRKVFNFLNRLEQLRNEVIRDPVYAGHFIEIDHFNKKVIFYINLIIHLTLILLTSFTVFNDYLTATETPNLLLPFWMPWNYQKSWPYVAAIIASTIVSLSIVSLYATLYTLLFTITLQMSALLKVLQAKMEVIRANDKSIFRQHINILQLLQQFNELFSGQYCLEILLASLQPCGTCYLLIKYLKNGDLRWLVASYKSIFTLFAPLTLCACGEEINSQVNNLHESAYKSSWNEEQPAARKDLLILMTVTSRPLQFQYKRLVVFNLLSFSKVVQGFYSYITMLINFGMND